jgi:ribonuclease BN (tRNA processing enzyme)
MRVTVVGSSCAIPRPGRACSAYMIEDEGAAFVLDFGSGAYASLRQHLDHDQIDAIVISHMHADHFLDLVTLRYAVRYGRHRSAPLPLWMPPGGIKALRSMVGIFAAEGREDFFDDAFALAEYDPNASLPIGSGRLTFAKTTHFIPAFAMRYESDAGTVTYSADTAPDQAVIALATHSDVFLCEATLADAQTESGQRGHCTAAQAGEMAQAAQVRCLVLTHYADDVSAVALERAARSTFSGNIIVGDDHQVLTIPTR